MLNDEERIGTVLFSKGWIKKLSKMPPDSRTFDGYLKAGIEPVRAGLAALK